MELQVVVHHLGQVVQFMLLLTAVVLGLGEITNLQPHQVEVVGVRGVLVQMVLVGLRFQVEPQALQAPRELEVKVVIHKQLRMVVMLNMVVAVVLEEVLL
jgi:hypothetical protein